MNRYTQALIGLAAVNFILSAVIFGFGNLHWTYENGRIETLQIVILLLLMLLFLRDARWAGGPLRTLYLALALLCLTGAAREVDPRGTFLPQGAVEWIRNGGQNGIMGAIAAALVLLLLAKWRHWSEILRLLLAPRSMIYAGAACLLLVGEYADSWLKPYGDTAAAIEELSELNGLLLFLWAAIILPLGTVAEGEVRQRGTSDVQPNGLTSVSLRRGRPSYERKKWEKLTVTKGRGRTPNTYATNMSKEEVLEAWCKAKQAQLKANAVALPPGGNRLFHSENKDSRPERRRLLTDDLWM